MTGGLFEFARHRRHWAISLAASAAAVAIIHWLPRQRFSATVFLALGVIWAGVVASQVRGKARDILLLVAALLIVPAIGEAVFAAITPEPGPFVQYSVRLGGDDATLGYAPFPSQTVKATKTGFDGRRVFAATYTIDRHGLRRTDSSPTGPTIAFFFDSMIFGEGVEDSETLPQQFADFTGRRYHVVNLGFPGYGPQAMLRTLETGFRDDVLTLNPAFFIIETAAWHAERAACRPSFVWQTPRYALLDGKAVFMGPCAGSFEHWRLRTLDQSYLYRASIQPLLVDRQHDLDIYLAELRDAARLAKTKYGAQVVILYLRSEADQFEGTTYTDNKIIDALRGAGASVLDVTRAEAGEDGLSIPGDGHPTAKANRLRASLLRGEIAKLAASDPDRHF